MLSFLSVFSPSLQFLITLWSKSHKGSLRNIFPNTFVMLFILFFVWDFSECQDEKVFKKKFMWHHLYFLSLWSLGSWEHVIFRHWVGFRGGRQKEVKKNLGLGQIGAPLIFGHCWCHWICCLALTEPVLLRPFEKIQGHWAIRAR